MMFSTYKEVDGENLYLRNSSTSKVLGVRKIILKMNSENLSTLNKILYVTYIRKNLVSGSLMSKTVLKWFLRVINLYSLKVACLYKRCISIMTF
jgi:hypothetical protein